MARIAPPAKPLAVNPLKASQPIGASLAFLGLAQTMPLEHGARGCAAFNKLFFMRHFREPIALQTTAMDLVSTVLGADGGVVEALTTVCEKNRPEVIGLITTGLTETVGADVPRALKDFRATRPEHASVSVIPVGATDALGCLETGFALAVEAILEALVPRNPPSRRRARQVNVLPSPMLTPGDVEAIKDWIGAFGLTPVVVPDLADSLDGHLTEEGFSALTYGGITRASIAAMGESLATLVIGPSLDKAADLLAARTQIPDRRFAGLLGLSECDAFTEALSDLSGRPVPARLERQRAQLQDAMVDCQFQIGGARIALAADPDLLGTLTRFFAEMGAEIVAAVASAKAASLGALPVEEVVIGDLEDLERLARDRSADLIATNSHGAEIARRLGVALLRAGFPLYDSYGAHARTWVGYAGSRQTLFDLANLLAGQYRQIRPYRSIYWQGTPRDAEASGRTGC